MYKPAPDLSPGSAAQPEGQAASALGVDLFRCQHCGAALHTARSGAPTCTGCGHAVPVIDGIVDFVAGAYSTGLDDIDYDTFYNINASYSFAMYDAFRRHAGALWRDDFGDALEVGSGTGGFSLAVSRNARLRRYVLTDVSTKMLATCRQRLRQAAPATAGSTVFATFSGVESCFRPGAFDTCFGTAVVHHIADVPRFLRLVSALLKPDGVAFFMEPNLAFHRALTATLADVAAEGLRAGSIPEADLYAMLSWMAEVHCNAVNAGDMEVLAEREDKHQFEPEVFAAWAVKAGFGRVDPLACDPDPSGWGTFGNYMQQSGVSPATLDLLKTPWMARSPAYFSGLGPSDRSPANLYWLHKTSAGPAKTWPKSRRPVPAANVVPALPVKLWLQIQAKADGPDVEIIVTGWCLSGEPVRALQIDACGVRRRLPVWRPRPDVQIVVNKDGKYPPLHGFCSGVEGSLTVSGPVAAKGRIEADMHIVIGPSDLRSVGTAILTVGGGAAELFYSFAL